MTRSPFSAHVALSASWARTSSSQRSSPACQALTYLWQIPSTLSSAFATANSTTTQSRPSRSEEHTSELQSRFDLVCRLLLEKKNSANTDQQTGDTAPCWKKRNVTGKVITIYGRNVAAGKTNENVPNNSNDDTVAVNRVNRHG